jgi:nucleotide-binding universal stress UspA family protein
VIIEEGNFMRRNLWERPGGSCAKLVPPEAEMWCELHFAVEHGPAAEKILEVAKQRKADLIVLGVRRPSGFPGAATHLPMATAHKVFTHAACPVLTVRG